jgi:hypothetical protein
MTKKPDPRTKKWPPAADAEAEMNSIAAKRDKRALLERYIFVRNLCALSHVIIA